MSAETQICHLCDKPAIGTVAGMGGANLPICAEHYIALMGVENERQRMAADQARIAMAMMNHAAADMDAAVGFGVTPKAVIPPPAPASTYASINVTDSTVGVINIATVGHISANIGALPAAEPAKAALAKFTSAVVNDDLLPADTKTALLEQLEAVSAEAAAPKANRKTAVVLPLLHAIGQTATVIAGLGETWHAVEPVLKAYFGL